MKQAALVAHMAGPMPHAALTIGTAVLVYSIGIGCWIVALGRLPLGVAYPVTSLSYIGILWGSSAWFGENITPLRIFGVALIFAGVALVVLNERTRTSTRRSSQRSSQS